MTILTVLVSRPPSCATTRIPRGVQKGHVARHLQEGLGNLQAAHTRKARVEECQGRSFNIDAASFWKNVFVRSSALEPQPSHFLVYRR